MGKPTGFLEIQREAPAHRSTNERVRDWKKLYQEFPSERVQRQSARCMECGVPFCHQRCPLRNVIPHWNELVYQNRWEEAVRILHATNNFPEFTGALCPAPCEAACVLGISDSPVTIKVVERTIIEHAFEQRWIHPEPPRKRTGKSVAVIGSGPSGLAAAQQLNRAGHHVTVYEKNERIGGLLRYGIPEFKLEKHIIDRRVELMQREGVVFATRVNVGVTFSAEEMRRSYDAIVLCGGAEAPRDIQVPGRELKGIHFAMDFLLQQNRRNFGDPFDLTKEIYTAGKRVVIIGGGDTGADCLGTCLRQGAASIHQFEVQPMPPLERSELTPWPQWPLQLRTESSHEEGGIREWSVATTQFEGDSSGTLKKVHAVRAGSPPSFAPVPDTEFTIDVDVALLAVGFTGPAKSGLLDEFGVALDWRGNVSTNDQYMTSVLGVFAAGDMRRGQSLIVWAIAEGRRAAECVDKYLWTTTIRS